MTGEEPFDRHDWIIDRCGSSPGQEPEPVRYVIDYFDTPDSQDDDDLEELEIKLDTRPALDSFSSAFDRIRFPIWKRFFYKPEPEEEGK